jgi:hypothetical protein
LLKKVKVSFIREIKAISNQGVEFLEKTELLKRKDGNVEAKVAEYKNFHLPLDQLDATINKDLECYRGKKPYVAAEMESWFTSL